MESFEIPPDQTARLSVFLSHPPDIPIIGVVKGYANTRSCKLRLAISTSQNQHQQAEIIGPR